MKKSLLLVSVALALFTQGCDKGFEKEIAAKEVPAAVMHAFTEAYPNAVVKSYAEETKKNQKVYEISFTNAGRKIDIAYASTGQVLEIEERLEQVELPESVTTTLHSELSTFTFKKAEKITKGDQIFYEVKVETPENGKQKVQYLRFAEDGKLLKKKVL